jgi:hypothetical protein
MNPKIQLVEITAEAMRASIDSIIGCALVYNQGKGYTKYLFKQDIEEEREWFDKGIVSDFVTDFCLDYMSGRIHPNQLCEALKIVSKNNEELTNKYKKKGGAK